MKKIIKNKIYCFITTELHHYTFYNIEKDNLTGTFFKHGNGYKSNYIMFSVNGKLHNENGPAVITSFGRKEWLINGLLHRLNGPAVEYGNDRKEWWIEGDQYLEEDYWRRINKYY